MSAGTLFVVSAPSGAGKTTLVNAVAARLPEVRVSVSHTSRPPRPGETEGIDYHFVSRDSFEKRAARGDFLEYAEVFGNLYGTSRSRLLALTDAGYDVILEIDWQGARQVRARVPGCTSAFVLPPSRAALFERLSARGQDSPRVIAARMSEAAAQVSHWREFDYLVINDRLETAVADVHAIIMAQRMRREAQAARYAPLIDELLSLS